MGTAADFPVKWMHSGMPRVPALHATAGSLQTLLDAFLVTGWGAMTPQRISVSGGIATVLCDVGDTFEQHMVIELSGAEQAELNGQHRVLSSTSTSFTFATDAADGFATGTISIKAAAAGWEKAFSDATRAAYRSLAPDANPAFFVVDDGGSYVSNAFVTRTYGYASMESISEGERRFPAEGVNSYWLRAWRSGYQNQGYHLFADPRFVIAALAYRANTAGDLKSPTVTVGFGDCVGLVSRGDAFASCILNSGVDVNYVYGGLDRAATNGFWAADVTGNTIAPSVAVASLSSTDFGTVSDLGRIVLTPRVLSARALAPGYYYTHQSGVMSAVPSGDTIRASIGGKERVLRAIPATDRVSASAAMSHVAFVDITGPWR